MITHDTLGKFSNFLYLLLRRKRPDWGDSSLGPPDLRDPEGELRQAELFSIERLEHYAEFLARELKVSHPSRRGRSLLPELRESGRVLLAAYQTLASAIKSKQTVSPAAEWLVDNFHIIEDQLREIKRDLPANYYHELPKLIDGEQRGYPRVYALAWALITHTDSRLDVETLRRFILAFESKSPLLIGELWALPITLRIALVENLRPLAQLIVSARKKREEADELADQLLEIAMRPYAQARDLEQLLEESLRKPEDFDRAFLVQLTQRLRDQDPDIGPALAWIDRQLESIERKADHVIQWEHHRQAAAQITVGNIITSMRLLSALDWRDFFESVSCVDPVLAQDPAGAYSQMDFLTRDHYRHTLERIARRSSLSEIEVASKAVAEAKSAQEKNPKDGKRAHVGFYLIGNGLLEFERNCGYRPRLRERIRRFLSVRPTALYLGSLIAVLSVFAFGLAWVLERDGASSAWQLGAVLIFLIPASEFALSFLNHCVTLLVRAQALPKMSTEGGIPGDAQTMVVIPTLFTTVGAVQELVESLQVHYLANQDPQISFALLGDLGDAHQESLPEDEAVIETARNGVDELNERYRQEDGRAKFFLFLRRRKWNPAEKKWMGWERKRGKLQEFNRLLRGASDTSYVIATATPEFMARIKYVITLDSDTQLPREAAHQLVGTILHPLNQPVYDGYAGRVIDGYGILQPRISVSLVSALRSRFARIFSGNTGLDPYTTAVSDVYQDLFCEGSYVGKGLYVVDAFEAALDDRIPENTLLSHDLFEGAYARSALVTDIELFDDYPADLDTFLNRQHRWTRGDWQICQWLMPRVPYGKGNLRAKNTLSAISRWKIFDNLRRSLVPQSILTGLVLGWTVLPGSPWVWTASLLLALAFPIYAPVTQSVLFFRPEQSWRNQLLMDWAYTHIRLKQFLLTLTFLVEQAWVQTDAILRTLYRVFVSRRNLLEWVSFAQVQGQMRNRRKFVWGVSPAFALLVGGGLVAYHSPALGASAPLLFLWLLAPVVRHWSREKPRQIKAPLDVSALQTLRNYARRTWHFFETFATAQENGLAPDNFQEDPKPTVAHRTSPTNIGLQLLSTVCAYDFGYLSLTAFLERMEMIFATLRKLPRLHGHFFNWYDTRTLEPLKPLYVSTVDSGNLAGHLLAVKQALAEIKEASIFPLSAREGLKDTLRQVLVELEKAGEFQSSSGVLNRESWRQSLAAAYRSVDQAFCRTLGEVEILLSQVRENLLIVEDSLSAAHLELPSFPIDEATRWTKIALAQVIEFERDLRSVYDAGAQSELRSGSTIATWIPGVRERLSSLMGDCDALVMEMDFRFLFDEERKIFVIGYNASDDRRDLSYYDLLASESRLASFVAIAKGDIPKEHWFRLGRKMTNANGNRALISWSATMFEYLMPLLVMRSYSETLLDETLVSVVSRQIEYGKQRGVPWGVSEAGYNARDLHLNFQYGPFGIPGLGLKRGLSDDLVVSPYSTLLAAPLNPRAALANLAELEKLGACGRYGFYESIDYTPERLPKKQKNFILKSFMAHHHGMSFVSLNNLLHDNVMQRRFHAEPLVQATDLLLQERIPVGVEITRPRAEEVSSEGFLHFSTTAAPRIYRDCHLSTPRTQILSNGNYTVMVTTAGAGYSRLGKLAVNRWREDVTRDHWGSFLYIRNRRTGSVWSAGYQPIGSPPDGYEVSFTEEKAEFWRKDGEIETLTEVIVSPEDPVELRRVSLTNHSDRTCEFEVTSFLETALAPASDDLAHPAFSNLFVQTEFIPEENALLATRRRRSQNEKQLWGFHVLTADGEVFGTGEKIGVTQYETDRFRFLGRGRDVTFPAVITENRPLSNTVGAVLDPIFSLRQSIRIPPGKTMRVVFATGVAESRTEALRLADKYHDVYIYSRESELAWTKSQVQLRHLNISLEKAHVYQRLAGRVVFPDPALRSRPHALALNSRTQASLWPYGISGDLPIVLTRIKDEKDMAMVRELLHAHEYLRLKGLVIDLVILNERAPSYLQSLQEELQKQIRICGSQALMDKPGGVFLRRTDIMPEEDIVLLKSVARVNLNAEKGTLDQQLRRLPPAIEMPAPFLPSVAGYPSRETLAVPLAAPALQFFNGLGGFTADASRHYMVLLNEGQWTPAPWINVVANEQDFGFIISESGATYTWSANSRENRLTPWSNDPVSDPSGEVLYLRDDETGDVWTPTPLPIREAETYHIRHAQGFSEFEHVSHGLAQRLCHFVPMDASVKISRLTLKNLSQRRRFISVTQYIEWVLGVNRCVSSPYVITEKDADTGAFFARNPYNNEFASRVAFCDLIDFGTRAPTLERSFTCDRTEFIGRNGTLRHPAALYRRRLSGAVGAGKDPCTAMQAQIILAPGEEREIVVLLGEGQSRAEAREWIERFRKKENIEAAFRGAVSHWNEVLDRITVRTPDAAMNTLVNRWLLYQTLSCRLWARTAFYQSGGAYGFRDQLQDVMALVHAKPELARQHILRAAARQFAEGDVQHWWHPPTGRGVRTHCSDDLLWLPFVAAFYAEVTGDESIWSEDVPFIEMRELRPEEDDVYAEPKVSSVSASLYEHCARSLDRSLSAGKHDLPLMGAGDWNDGMNRVGHEGKGESVWVGWFLFATLRQFLPICEQKGDTPRLSRYHARMDSLSRALEERAWDGDWYRRAYFDDGAVLGSAANQECRIDSIAQSWAVLSGAGNPDRAVRAMGAVDEYLVHRGEGLIKLFTPAFDQSAMDPGYIKGYLPGVRENGGQYTHAAIWSVMAFAELGEGDLAGELFTLLNPISHSSSRAGLHKYKVEPYVAAADVYGISPHVGRGGWTWYTGSASWMYRSALESILGFRRKGAQLEIKPCIPKLWTEYEIHYRYGSSPYTITVKNSAVPASPASMPKVELDGHLIPETAAIQLSDDGKEHQIRIWLG